MRRLGRVAVLLALLLGPPIASPRVASAQAAATSGRVVVAGEDLTSVGYDVGSATAPVVIVNFSDFGCPWCARFSRESWPALEEEFVRTGQVRYKYVPFAMGGFPNGKQAARASECAAEQGRFWPMHERIYATQTAWRNTIDALPVFLAEARRLGLDEAGFTRCYETRATDRRTEGASMLARRLGIRATPSFFVDGRLVEGALPLPQFQALLRAVLRERSAP